MEEQFADLARLDVTTLAQLAMMTTTISRYDITLMQHADLVASVRKSMLDAAPDQAYPGKNWAAAIEEASTDFYVFRLPVDARVGDCRCWGEALHQHAEKEQHIIRIRFDDVDLNKASVAALAPSLRRLDGLQNLTINPVSLKSLDAASLLNLLEACTPSLELLFFLWEFPFVELDEDKAATIAQGLCRFTALQDLRLMSMKVASPSSWRILLMNILPSLTSLSFSHSPLIEDVTGEPLVMALRRLSDLKELEFSYTKLTAKFAAQIAEALPKAMSLSIVRGCHPGVSEVFKAAFPRARVLQ